MTENQPYLRIASLAKGFGQGAAHVQVLSDITCQVDRGEICVLFGPSGSGKSTFLNLVGGLERPDAGQIEVGGTDICSLSDRDLVEYRRRELGFIFQFYNLVPDLTIRENVEVCQHLSKDPLPVDDLLHSLSAAPSAAPSSRTRGSCSATSPRARSTTRPRRRSSA